MYHKGLCNDVCNSNVRHFIFGAQMDQNKCYPTDYELNLKGHGDSCNPSKFGTSCIFLGEAMHFQIYTVSQNNPCDYVFDDNLNRKRPIVIIFGTVIT